MKCFASNLVSGKNNQKTTQRLSNQYCASLHNVTFVRRQKQNIT
jgi:hypothetical protein